MPKIMETACILGLLQWKARCQYVQYPIALTPAKYPRSVYEALLDVQPLMNKLQNRVARDPTWMYEQLESVIGVDDFTRRLVEISRKVHSGGIKQSVCFQVNRSDYLLDGPSNKAYQVEFNTIASGFSAMNPKMSEFHQFVTSNYSTLSKDNVPKLNTQDSVQDGFVAARQAYGGRGIVLVISSHDCVEGNAFDQYNIELELWRRGIDSVRFLFNQLTGRISLKEDILYVDDKEICIVYFREGYMPDQYTSDEDWNIREMIELSKAIKTPNIDYQLSGSKKIQEALCVAENLARFLDSPEEVSKVSEFFTEMYPIVTLESEILSKVRENPSDWVLKPQREGGGNNFYDQDIIDKLDSSSLDELKQYTLMKKIKANASPAVFMREGQKYECTRISELGVYGIVLSDGE